ncbi:MAG: acyl carrier protein [Clostridia bacterium]|nr:acyl carrier protein [Clostridia bacterium]
MHNFERICEIMNEVAGVPKEQVTPESTVDQLHLDSLDVTELILSIEDEFGILVEDDSEIRSVNDLLVRLDKTA